MEDKGHWIPGFCANVDAIEIQKAKTAQLKVSRVSSAIGYLRSSSKAYRAHLSRSNYICCENIQAHPVRKD